MASPSLQKVKDTLERHRDRDTPVTEKKGGGMTERARGRESGKGEDRDKCNQRTFHSPQGDDTVAGY